MSGTGVGSTLAKKLAKGGGGRFQKLRAELQSEPVVADIEDAAGNPTITSKYFSPVQTRRQRIRHSHPPHKLELVETKPRRKRQLNEEILSSINKTEKVIEKDQLKEEEKLISIFKTEKDAEKDAASSSGGSTSSQWQPEHWRQHLDNIREMRWTGAAAPVDTMGCQKCSDQDADEKTQRFHKLVALMLSSQTKDETTYAAMQRLKANQLTPQTIVAMEATALQELLCPVSFYKNKSKFLQQAAQLLIDKYDSDIPSSVKELEALPGVGPKMAHICMATAWNVVTGVGVDVHVHRITNRLRWLPKATKQPEQTRIALEAWLPRDLWREINHLLVGFGQTVCTPVRPHCGDCLNRAICPAAELQAGKKKTVGKSGKMCT